MVNGPGRVIFAARSVFLRRNCMSCSSTGPLRFTGPTTRGTAVWVLPVRATIIAGLSPSIPSSAVAKRLE